MYIPRHIEGVPRLFGPALLYICLLTFSLTSPARAQQTIADVPAETARGVELYRKGETKEAIAQLRRATKANKTDALAWHYLGLSLARDSQEKEARKAFEAAVKAKPDFAAARVSWAYMLLLAGKDKDAEREARQVLTLDQRSADAHYILGVIRLHESEYSKALEEADAALKLNSDLAAIWLLRSQALVGGRDEGAIFVSPEESGNSRRTRFKEAADSLEKYLQLIPAASPNVNTWREQLETLRFLSSASSETEPGSKIYSPKSVATKARILSRGEPQYTDRARAAGVAGTVVLRAVFASDGTVKHILVVKGLEYGLTEAAVRAARKIKFLPAQIDGRPVSQYVQIEYNFNLY
jgi:TonB family protein